MSKTSKNVKVFALVLITSVLLLSAVSLSLSSVKAQTQDSLYVYTSCGGTISADGTNLTGGSSYNYANNAAITFTAIPVSGFNFLCWETAAGSGAAINTTNPFVYTITSTEAAIQAMFVPTVNASLPTSAAGTGTGPFEALISIGGTTTPAAGTYTNYTIGQVVNFVANPGSNFKFLYWIVPSASGGASTTTDSQLAFTVTANACAIQAFFIPSSASVTLPTPAPTVNEFSSATAIIIVIALVMAAMGTLAYTKRIKK